MHGKLCDGSSALLGEDAYVCNLQDSSLAQTMADGFKSFVDMVSATGGDVNAKFVGGNVIAETFKKVQSSSALPDSAFPSELSQLILGQPTTDPQNDGLSSTEAAMNLFGYYRHGPAGVGDIVTSKYLPSTIEDVGIIATEKLENCDGENCRRIYQCNDIVLTDSSGNDINFTCGSHTTTATSYTNYVAVYNAETDCTDKESDPTLVEFVRCQVQAGYTKIANGNNGALTGLQQKIIQASPAPVMRALTLGNDQDKGRMLAIMGEQLGQYLTYKLLYTYINDLAQFSSSLLRAGKDELDIAPTYLTEIFAEIDRKVEQAQGLKEMANKYLSELQNNVEYVRLLEKYERSLAHQVSSQAGLVR